MKKGFFFMLCLFPRFLYCQNQYIPLIEDGKTWNYEYYNDNTGVRNNFSHVAQGDTIIGGATYKKIVDASTQSYQYAVREDDRKVYAMFTNQDKESLLYDFNLKAGDIVCRESSAGTTETIVVTVVDTIKMETRLLPIVIVSLYEALPVGTPREEWDMYGHFSGFWIEGIGSLYGLSNPFLVPGNNISLVSCQIGGEVIFNRQNFQHSVGIHSSQLHYNSCESAAYNLQGRRLSGKPASGLYIRDGKKYVVK